METEALLVEARRTEMRLLMLCGGLLEGETAPEVIHHLADTLPPLTVIALMNVHAQLHMHHKREKLRTRRGARGRRAAAARARSSTWPSSTSPCCSSSSSPPTGRQSTG